MKNKRLIPFRFLPGSWGLTGQIYLEAEASYNLSGEALEKRLIEIRHADDPATLKEKLLDIEVKAGRLSQYDRDLSAAMDGNKGTDQELAVLGVDLKHNKIDKNKYDKETATIKHEPWVGIINQGFDPAQGMNGVYFEFDWNADWIAYLQANGYAGHNDEQIVEQWFSDVCKVGNISAPNGHDAFLYPRG